jgi:DNA (cytosine-5)-methyltransferase 3A
MAIKILIGGSPCTYWSIAQTNNRETKAEGMGWELFKNYLIAKEKFKPDFFLYENNKSASQAIKDQIAEEFGVGVDPDVRFTYINSALVSAQNRQRFYVTNFGDIEQPDDRGILLKDILETGDNLTSNEKSFALTTRCQGAIPEDTIRRRRHSMVAEPINIDNTLCFKSNDNYVQYDLSGKNHNSQDQRAYYVDGKHGTLNASSTQSKTGVIEPVTITRTVQYAIPQIVEKYGYIPEMFNAYDRQKITDKSPTLSTGSMVTSSCATNKFESIQNYAIACEWDENGKPTKAISGADGKTYTVYEVKDGQITIKDKQYLIKLKDGYYIIRKLTVAECARLQTMPDDYCKAVSDSQAYKALGNGWTAEVIIHLLNHALKDVPRDEEIIVLSMYDGIATGRYCLDKMGFTNVTYHAYEIDKYPIMVAMDNYPDIIQHGDAFAVREDDWKPPQTRSEWLDELLGGDL